MTIIQNDEEVAERGTENNTIHSHVQNPGDASPIIVNVEQ